MTIAELDMYMTTTNDVENRIIDDTKFPVVSDSSLMLLCYIRTIEIKFKLSKSKYKCLQKENITKQFRRKMS